jgi:hypothetical protein
MRTVPRINPGLYPLFNKGVGSSAFNTALSAYTAHPNVAYQYDITSHRHTAPHTTPARSMLDMTGFNLRWHGEHIGHHSKCRHMLLIVRCSMKPTRYTLLSGACC